MVKQEVIDYCESHKLDIENVKSGNLDYAQDLVIQWNADHFNSNEYKYYYWYLYTGRYNNRLVLRQ